jgi:hypothetical protein
MFTMARLETAASLTRELRIPDVERTLKELTGTGLEMVFPAPARV